MRFDHASGAFRHSPADHFRGRKKQQTRRLARQLQHAIARRLCQQLVKFGIDLGKARGVADGGLRLRLIALQRLDRLRRRVLGRLFGGGDFQHMRGGAQFAEGHFMQDQRAAHARRQPAIARQARIEPAIGAALHQTRLLEHPDGFAHGRAIDAELVAQCSLGADAVARAHAAGNDFALDRFGHQLIGRGDFDFFQALDRRIHQRSPGGRKKALQLCPTKSI